VRASTPACHCLATFLTGIDSSLKLTIFRCREATDQIRVAKRSAEHGCREIKSYILSEKLSIYHFQYRERKQFLRVGTASLVSDSSSSTAFVRKYPHAKVLRWSNISRNQPFNVPSANVDRGFGYPANTLDCRRRIRKYVSF
jgi:hypothetical protein